MLKIEGRFVSVFNIEDKGTYSTCNLSSSKKNADGTYTNMSWKAKFVGATYDRAKELKDKDKINIKSGIIENTYDKENKKSWYTVTIFNFEREAVKEAV